MRRRRKKKKKERDKRVNTVNWILPLFPKNFLLPPASVVTSFSVHGFETGLAGSLSRDGCCAVSQRTNSVLGGMGEHIVAFLAIGLSK